MKTILVVDTNSVQAGALVLDLMKEMPADTLFPTAGSVEQALTFLRDFPNVDAIFADLGEGTVAFLRQAREAKPGAKRVMLVPDSRAEDVSQLIHDGIVHAALITPWSVPGLNGLLQRIGVKGKS